MKGKMADYIWERQKEPGAEVFLLKALFLFNAANMHLLIWWMMHLESPSWEFLWLLGCSVHAGPGGLCLPGALLWAYTQETWYKFATEWMNREVLSSSGKTKSPWERQWTAVSIGRGKRRSVLIITDSIIITLILHPFISEQALAWVKWPFQRQEEWLTLKRWLHSSP